ncbi:MAG: hypothetical protein EXR67_03295 [Dehalococcoidia bacterium]|nr:hypothetical protein [Dehalococcoidia bacterium]
MPEAPDLHVIKEVLNENLKGVAITGAHVLRPSVLRSMVKGDFVQDITGKVFLSFWRKGKVLGCELGNAASAGDATPNELGMSGFGPARGAPARLLVINPMLSGGLQFCDPNSRVTKKTFLTLSLSNEYELRYFDDDQMGMVYYIEPDQLFDIPRLLDQGRDVLDMPMSLDAFTAALKPFRGEIKGILTRGELVSGIGNAYADEVCFAAGLFPFRKVTQLEPEEVERLWRAVYAVPREAIPILRERVGYNIHLKVRDFLKVHGKAGQPCPRCGGRITEIRANGRLHNYCRTCQPGLPLWERVDGAGATDQNGVT